MKRILIVSLTLTIACAFLNPTAAVGAKKDELKEYTPAGPRLLKKYHLHIPDKATEKQFLELFQMKKELNEDMIVLQRLTEEKMALYAEAQKNLLRTFGVLPDGLYQYDRDTRTIFQLIPEPRIMDVHDEKVDDGDDMGRIDRQEYLKQVHQQLPDVQAGNRFLEMLRQKKLIHNELVVLRALAVQKQLGLQRVNQQLQAKFSLSADGMYNYDADEMALYELVPAEGKR